MLILDVAKCHRDFVPRTQSADRFRICLLSLMIVLSAGFLTPADGQIAPEKKICPGVRTRRAVRILGVLEAGFREDFMGTLGYLNLKNIFGSAFAGRHSLRRILRCRGRLCFSLVFSLNKDPRESHAIAPGESVRSIHLRSECFRHLSPRT